MTMIKSRHGAGVTSVGGVTFKGIDKPGMGWVSTLALTAYAGRMNRLAVAVPGSVRQADGTYALDLTAQRDAATVDFESGGQNYVMNVSASAQEDGWGAGDYYMLERDPGDASIIVEPGRNHRKWYASNSPDAWTKDSIAAAESISPNAVSDNWLIANPFYGGSEEQPLLASLAVSAWRQAQLGTTTSNWILYERGYDYGGLDATPQRRAQGESPLHPMLIGSWGTGPRPRGLSVFNSAWCPSHLVIRDISFDAIGSLFMWNWLITDCDNIKGDAAERRGEFGAQSQQSGEGFTGYRVDVTDVSLTSPKDGMLTWGENPHKQRLGGSYWNNVHGLLLEEVIWDHNGWADGYDPTGAGGANTPQPPSQFSHNVYSSTHNSDQIYDHVISARAASQGLQTRSGAQFVDSLLLDNNIAGNDGGGNTTDYTIQGPRGNFSLHLGNVITSAGWRVAPDIGAINWGMDIFSKMPSLVDVIVIHCANPDDPDEVALKVNPDFSFKSLGPYNAGKDEGYFDNAIVYRWKEDFRTEGLDPAVLDRTTIQRHAADLLGQPTATIADYMTYIRGVPLSQRRAAIDATLNYFRAPCAANLDQSYVKRVNAVECVFTPDDRGEGFRWDNRLNWSTGDRPGSVPGDSVNLYGNRVKFGRFTTEVDSIAFGGGLLEVTSGKLTALAHADAANLSIRECGQYVAPAGSDGSIAARGGRLTFAGAASGDLAVSGMAEVLLGPDYAVGANQTLRIDGGRCFIGWDGTGSASLTVAGTLDFRATPILCFGEYAFNARFRKEWPLVGGTSGFTGKVDSLRWGRRNNAVFWDVAVRDMQGRPEIGEKAAATSPRFGDDKVWTPYVLDVRPSEIGTIAPFRKSGDDPAPTVAATVVLEAGSTVTVDSQGLAPGSYDLIVADSITDNGATLPAGVSIMGGNVLRLTVA
tara:strand:- start:230 stop:3004 length:2775 start_codon:yes stop_codon:yes gene_type:complete